MLTITGRHLHFLLLVACAVASRAFAAPIEFEAETLPNGLRVIYAPLRQAPVVHVRMIYHVGSRDERPDRQGFAHMFEHMMFRGSAHIGPQEHRRLVRSVGGDVNGQTDHDMTSYFQTLPRNQLALGLYLEADRMGSFHVTEEIYRIERNVVLEELTRDLGNPFNPIRDALLGEIFNSHPYRWSPIGNADHLNAADVRELQQFFDRYYVPNNATLVITGDFDPPAAKRLVGEYFGWIARGQDLRRDIPRQPPQTATRRIEIQQPIATPAMMLGFRVPGFGSDDEAAVILLRQVVDAHVLHYLRQPARPLCSSAFVRLISLEDDGLLCLGAALLPHADLAEVQRIATVRFQILREAGLALSNENLNTMTDHLCAQLLDRRRTAEGLAEQIGRGAVLRGQPDATDRLIARLQILTVPMIRQAIAEYLRPEDMTLLIARPGPAQPKPPIAALDEPPAQASAARPTTFPANFPALPPVASDFPRLPPRQIIRLQVDGLNVLLTPGLQPLGLRLGLLFPHGSRTDPAGKEGLGRLTTSLLANEIGKPTIEMARGLPIHEPFAFGWNHELDHTAISANAPAPVAHWLMAGINRGLRTRLGSINEDWLIDQKRDLLNQAILANNTDLGAAGADLLGALFDGSSLGRESNAASLRAIMRDDLERSQRELFSLNGAALVISADITPDVARALVQRLTQGLPAAVPTTLPAADVPELPRRQRPRIILVDAPYARQSLIRIGSAAVGLSEDELSAAQLGQWALSQRLWQTVRQERGAAYDIDATFTPFRGGGMFSVSTRTMVSQTGSTLAILFEGIGRMSSASAAAGELRDAKLGYTGGIITGMQTPYDQASWQALAIVLGTNPDVQKRIDQVHAVDSERIVRLFSRHARPEQLVVVIVGPARQILAQVERFGDLEIRRLPQFRPGAATRPAHEEIPRRF